MTALDDLTLIGTLLDRAELGVALVDGTFRILRSTPVFAAACALAPGDHLGETLAEAAPHLWPSLEPVLRRVLAGETVLDRDLAGAAADGAGPAPHRQASFYPLRLDGGVPGVGIVVSDVTERRQVEDALERRNDLYAMLSGAGRAVAQSRSSDELFHRICQIAVETGKFRFAWIGVPENGHVRLVASAGTDNGYMAEAEITVDELDPRSHGPTGKALRTGAWVVENDFLAATSTEPWHELARRTRFASSAAFPIEEGGWPVAVLSLYSTVPGFFTEDFVETLGEVTPTLSLALDRFAAERDLLLHDRAIRAVSQGIVITDARDPENGIVYVSPGFEQLAGYAAEEVLGRTCSFLEGEATSPAALEQIHNALRERCGCAVEFLAYRRAGSTFWNSLTISPIVDENGETTHFVGVNADITARRLLEEQVRQRQKLEAVGRLAAGIAHDFNNLLTVIFGCTSLLLETSAPDDPYGELVVDAHQATERAAELTQKLLAFSRQQVLEPKVLSLNAVTADVQRMLTRLLGDDDELALSLGPDAGMVKIDPGGIEQILINLTLNASDAMPGGGTITISTRNVTVDAAGPGPHVALAAGDYVVLEVSDTGVGMDEATRARAFEPFFTTKDVSKGTGLGLATVHGIVEQSGGHVALSTSVGHGTTVRVYLPRSGEAPAAGAVVRRAGRLPAGTETLLVVEDDDAVRSLAQNVLESCGYRVLTAANGTKALQLFSSAAEPIDLLVTDVAMPQLGGRELAERVRALRPGCRVLFMSGYADAAAGHRGVLESGAAFLHKPFAPSSLALKVRDVLDAPR